MFEGISKRKRTPPVAPGVVRRPGIPNPAVVWGAARLLASELAHFPENARSPLPVFAQRHGWPRSRPDRVLLVPPDHPLAGKQRVRFRDLAGVPFLMSGSGCGPAIRRLFAAEGLEPEVVLTVRDARAFASHACAGEVSEMAAAVILKPASTSLPYKKIAPAKGGIGFNRLHLMGCPHIIQKPPRTCQDPPGPGTGNDHSRS